jgi:putative ABC transport system permease protein
VIDALLLRPLPYPGSERMVMVWQDMTRRGGPDTEWFTPPDFVDLREQTTSFEAVAAVGGWSPALTTDDGAVGLSGALVSWEWFRVVGVQPALGAAFRPETELPGAAPVVVLSDGLWQRAFGGDPGVIGRTIQLNDVAHEVVGVMPPGFRDPMFDAELWRSRVINAAGSCGRGCYTMRVMGRLGSGVPLARAQTDARQVAARLAAEHPENRDVDFRVIGLRDDLVAEARPALLALAVAVALLLLIAMVNVANLLIARAGVRERELAIRSALGAARVTLVRQMILETAVLGVAGALAGAVIAVWAVDVLIALAPEGTPRIDEVGIGAASLMFALAAGIIAAVLAAVGPALQASRGVLADVMKEAGGHRTSVARRRTRSALVAGEIAIALTLLIGSTLTLRSLARLQQLDPGFRSEHIVTGGYLLPSARYPDDASRRAFVAAALERIAALPGVEQVATTSILPMTQGDSDTGFRIEGVPLAPDEQPPGSWYRMVSPNFFDVMGMRIVDGRGFTADDRAVGDDGVMALVVNREFERRFLPDGAVGRRIGFGASQPRAEIVGVVANTLHRGLGSAPVTEMYFSTLQTGASDVELVIRTGHTAAAIGPAVVSTVRGIDPALPPPVFRPMADIVAQTIALPRLYSAFFTFFAVVALLLAAIGVYGLTAYTVTQRRQEIGIRMALGARTADVVGMVVRHALLLTAAGLGIGLVASYALSRPLAVLLFGLSPHDFVTFTAIPALLGGIALVASWLPARRAARVDPLSALRSE